MVMKKRISMFMSALVITLLFPATNVFAGACSNITIQHIGTSPVPPSGVEVWLKNESGTACPEVPAGPAVQTYLSSTNTDRTLAVMLTAASLGKKVWVYMAGASAPYTIGQVQVLSITN